GLVGNFACEWTDTINDEAQLKRFSHFINADDRDENVVFVDDGREQHRPATFTEKHPEAKGDILHVELV
ncbi:hypothetical protein AB4400_25290, partial [Vibrio sp. 10N.261.48.A2]